MFSRSGSFCLWLWTLFCLRPSSSEFQVLFEKKFLLNSLLQNTISSRNSRLFCEIEFTFFQCTPDILGCSEKCDGVAESCKQNIHKPVSPWLQKNVVVIRTLLILGCWVVSRWSADNAGPVGVLQFKWTSPSMSPWMSMAPCQKCSKFPYFCTRKSSPAKSLWLGLVPICGSLQICCILSGLFEFINS